MPKAFHILFKFAVAHATAFFLCGQELPRCTYLKDKVEVVRIIDDSSPPSIFNLESNQSIEHGDLIATAESSRVECLLPMSTWRLGSLTVGKWTDNYSFWIHSGSILFCTEEAQVIHFSSREANATFEGSGTLIIEALENGGFKIIPLEVKGTITTAKGGTKELQSARLLLVLGSPSYFGDAYDIDLMLMLKSSRLINAYPTPLPTMGRIGLSVYKQDLKLRGKYNALIGDAPTNDKIDIWALSDEGNDGLDVESLLQK